MSYNTRLRHLAGQSGGEHTKGERLHLLTPALRSCAMCSLCKPYLIFILKMRKVETTEVKELIQSAQAIFFLVCHH